MGCTLVFLGAYSLVSRVKCQNCLERNLGPARGQIRGFAFVRSADKKHVIDILKCKRMCASPRCTSWVEDDSGLLHLVLRLPCQSYLYGWELTYRR